MILCDIYLFIVIIIIRQLFKTHQTTQEKSGEPFFFSLFARPTIHFFKISPNNKQQKKRGRASQINQIQSNHKVCCQNFFLFVLYIYIQYHIFNWLYNIIKTQPHILSYQHHHNLNTFPSFLLFLFPFSHIASFKFVFQILCYKILILIYLYNIHTLTPLHPSSFIFITQIQI